MHQILLIDDDEKLAGLLTRYFQQHELALKHAAAPSSGFRMLAEQPPELIILDVMLPEMDGFEVCKRIRQDPEIGRDIPILMLTARGEVMDRIVGLELGADDYLPKPFEPRELVARIHSILKRAGSQAAQSNASHRLEFGPLCVDIEKLEASLSGQVLPLSHLEFRLLEMFARSSGKPLSRDDILNKLKGTDADLFTRSVDILVSRLRQKLKPVEPIKTVRGVGYVFTGASL
ncbi:MAG: response regulator transcription factor [Gammaproteobacteria bacterium]